MCAGFAQVTLVELRASTSKVARQTETTNNTNNQTTNKTKQKNARATFKVTRRALKARGRVRQGR